jgi:putative glutamine amidotransferase
MARRPVIGITLELHDSMLVHVEKGLRVPLEESGALVIALPRDTPAAEIAPLLAIVDAVVLSGGADVDPEHYGHDRHTLTETVPAPHDVFEIGLARAALAGGVPILGICRGAQVLAVADGGTLTQDIPSEHDGAHSHSSSWRDTSLDPPGDHWHDVLVEPGSLVEQCLAGGPSRVNSYHHQCVRTVGTRLRATARAVDGVIEATERRDGAFAMGLQWHNELMWRHDDRYLRPHRLLAEAARRHAAR